MNVGNLFLSFQGRIGRLHFWIGTVVIEVVGAALQWGLGVPISTDSFDLRLRVIAFVIGLISLYPLAAIAVKRLHDRDKPGSYVWVLLAAFAVSLVADLIGHFSGPGAAGFVRWIVLLAAGVVALAFLIELGFRRGTPGSNDYGADPLPHDA
jgi:uncharacterized membrane protein YhaH (DUF805 family)